MQIRFRFSACKKLKLTISSLKLIAIEPLPTLIKTPSEIPLDKTHYIRIMFYDIITLFGYDHFCVVNIGDNEMEFIF